jgi:mycothiol synthase
MSPVIPDLVSLSDAHLPAMLDILAHTVYTNALSADWLRYRALEDPSCPADLSLTAQEHGQTVGLIVTRLRSNEGVVKMFAVHPNHRRRGVASALFDELESRLRARRVSKVTVGAVGPNFFVPGVDLRSTDAISFLLHRGYDTDRVTRVDMAVDLARADVDTSAEEDRLGQAGIAVRRARREELPAVAEFALRHFSEGWRFEILETARFDPPPLFVAWQGAEVLSFAAYDVTGLTRFGPTGTRPDYRRRGLGGVLLKRCLSALRERGEAVCEIGWAGPIGYYARAVDAVIHKSYWVFTKTLDE